MSTTTKTKGPPSSTRIRDNQRRSRAQRKELLDSLQQRVYEYERRGVAATVEVQNAAKSVARENAALRRLLARHGVAREEIEREVGKGCGEDAGDGGRRVEKLQIALGPQFREGGANLMTAPASSCGNSNTCNQAQNSCGAVDPQLDNLSNPGGLTTAIAPRPPRLAISDSTSAAESSCIAAATIIAQMRGDGDDDYARTMLLGCHGTSDCRVKNTTVFRVLDEV